MRVSALKKLIRQLCRQACCDRALGLFGTREEPRSIVQSRTIERRVLVTNCARRRSQRDDRGGQAGPVVDAHARDARTGAGAPPGHLRDEREPSRWLGVTAELNSARLGRRRNRCDLRRQGVEARIQSQ